VSNKNNVPPPVKNQRFLSTIKNLKFLKS